MEKIGLGDQANKNKHMGILITFLFFCLLIYSILGGIIIFGEYSSSPMTGDNEKEKKQSFSNANKLFLKKLIKYSLIVLIPTYFMPDILGLVGLQYEAGYRYTLIAVPLFLWANTLIAMASIFFDFLMKLTKKKH